jgi:phosphatidate cytidylyltransferase
VIALVPCGVSLNVLKSTPQAESLIVLLLMLIWSADIGAYFVGRRFGQRKLLPAVSPGKSVEGLFGGLAVTLIVGLLLTVTVAPIAQMPVPAALWGFVFVVIALVSVLGDLTLSMFKRIRGIKDSSQLLPGHGGILDRLDSLYSSAPLFAVLVTYLVGQA